MSFTQKVEGQKRYKSYRKQRYKCDNYFIVLKTKREHRDEITWLADLSR